MKMIKNNKGDFSTGKLLGLILGLIALGLFAYLIFHWTTEGSQQIQGTLDCGNLGFQGWCLSENTCADMHDRGWQKSPIEQNCKSKKDKPKVCCLQQSIEDYTLPGEAYLVIGRKILNFEDITKEEDFVIDKYSEFKVWYYPEKTGDVLLTINDNKNKVQSLKVTEADIKKKLEFNITKVSDYKDDKTLELKLTADGKDISTKMKISS